MVKSPVCVAGTTLPVAVILTKAEDRKKQGRAVVPKQVAEVGRRSFTVEPLLGRHHPLELHHVAIALGHHPHKLPRTQLADRVVCGERN